MHKPAHSQKLRADQAEAEILESFDSVPAGSPVDLRVPRGQCFSQQTTKVFGLLREATGPGLPQKAKPPGTGGSL